MYKGTGRGVGQFKGLFTEVPDIECPECKKTIHPKIRSHPIGWNYICSCGYKFWVIQSKDHESWYPRFKNPQDHKSRRNDVPEPEEVNRRISVMRQWKVHFCLTGSEPSAYKKGA